MLDTFGGIYASIPQTTTNRQLVQGKPIGFTGRTTLRFWTTTAMKLFSLKPDSTMKTRHICEMILLAGLTAVSCYEDKGDYDYHEINEVTISLQKQ